MEIEAKFKVSDPKKLKKKAESLGFSLKKKKRQIDTYFIVNKTMPDGTRHYLRIREDPSKETVSFDYHRVLSLLETDETEMVISDKDKLVKILGFLGYKIQCVVDKTREQYEKGKITLTFDNVPGLGDFVEVEIEGELNKENESLINKTIKDLCLNSKDRVKKKGYPDLLIEAKSA
jgi:adenylate cyclase class 2